MKIIFAGTPEFAVSSLMALINSEHQVSLILTQPDRPAGRGMHAVASPVKKIALEYGIPLYQPLSLKNPEAAARIKDEAADLMVVVAYGLILPPNVIELPRYRCINVHASLLPRWRGAAPIQRAILAGDEITGVCIMQMEQGLDTGDLLNCQAIAIDKEDNSTSLTNKLAKLGADLLVVTLAKLQLEGRGLLGDKQDKEGITYAQKISKGEAKINWANSAQEIERQIRAYDPFPGALTKLSILPNSGNQPNLFDCKIWRALVFEGDYNSLLDQASLDQVGANALKSDIAKGVSALNYTKNKTVGQILIANKNTIYVQCGEGVLNILEMQKAGGKRMSATQFFTGLRASHVEQGACFV